MGHQEINPDQRGTDRLLSLKDVANRLNISIRSVWRLIARRELERPVKVGKATRFIPSELEAYLEKLKQKRGAVTP